MHGFASRRREVKGAGGSPETGWVSEGSGLKSVSDLNPCRKRSVFPAFFLFVVFVVILFLAHQRRQLLFFHGAHVAG